MRSGMARAAVTSDDAGVSELGLDSLAEQAAVSAVAAHRGERGALLPVLHDVVAELGYVPDAAVRAVAEQLNLSRAEVHGVVSFYKDLRTEPPGRVVVGVCRGEACQSLGAEQLVREVSAELGVALESTRDDGAVTLDEVFCLGNCALGPSAMVDGRLHGRLTAQRLCALVEAAVGRHADGEEAGS